MLRKLFLKCIFYNVFIITLILLLIIWCIDDIGSFTGNLMAIFLIVLLLKIGKIVYNYIKISKEDRDKLEIELKNPLLYSKNKLYLLDSYVIELRKLYVVKYQDISKVLMSSYYSKTRLTKVGYAWIRTKYLDSSKLFCEIEFKLEYYKDIIAILKDKNKEIYISCGVKEDNGDNSAKNSD